MHPTQRPNPNPIDPQGSAFPLGDPSVCHCYRCWVERAIEALRRGAAPGPSRPVTISGRSPPAREGPGFGGRAFA
jgi:hypothetical protein